MTRITIDYTPAIQQHAGIGRYADELTHALLALDTDDEFRLFYVDPAGRTPAPPLDRLTRTTLQRSNKPWRLQLLLASYLHRSLDRLVDQGTDVFHATDHVLPRLTHTRSVFTLHDLTVVKHPETHSALNRWFSQLMLPRFLRAADAIIAVSFSTQQDAATLYGIAADRMRVVHLGVRPRFKSIDPAVCAAARTRYRLPDRFILTVGTIEPRKNMTVLLESYRILKDQGTDLKLVIAGKPGWHYQPFFSRLRDLGLEHEVILPGFLPDEDLPAVYALAEVFAFPSLYEGFGLPALEAMACGTPVICSNTSSLPEVAGDAALLITPTDVRSWAQALAQVTRDRAFHAELRQRGLRQAARFTWEETARQTLAIYHETLALK